MLAGVPNIRIISMDRLQVTSSAALDALYAQIYPALTNPLTSAEMQGGTFTPPPQPRIALSGTLDQAQSFFQREQLYMCGIPMTQWTDALPIIVPTEQKVAEMLTGTSHAPTETIYPYTRTGPHSYTEGTTPVAFQPMLWSATVEKVAVNAVMAGCKPEHLPIILAIATSGVSTGTTTMWSEWEMVAGPIVGQVGMNFDIGVMDGQNIANACIGRAYQLMAINLGGAQVGTNRMNTLGSPWNLGGVCLGEAPPVQYPSQTSPGPALPPGWLNMCQDKANYAADESCVLVKMTGGDGGGFTGNQFAPSSYRALQASGTGGLAHRILSPYGLYGQTPPPGKSYNWLLYLLPGLFANNWGSFDFLITPQMAMGLYQAGFTSKAMVYNWLWQNSFATIDQYKNYGWWDFKTNSGKNTVPAYTSSNFQTTPIYPAPNFGPTYPTWPAGTTYNEVPSGGYLPTVNTPTSSLILVTGGGEEVSYEWFDEMGTTGANITPIDPWR